LSGETSLCVCKQLELCVCACWQDCGGVPKLALQLAQLVMREVQNLGPVPVKQYSRDELRDELLQG
jgi:hypothetical protein